MDNLPNTQPLAQGNPDSVPPSAGAARQEDGGPAFPGFEPVERFNQDAGRYEFVHLPQGGMTLRDYFAAKAVVRWLPGELLMEGMKSDGVTRGMQLRTAAQNAYAIADAMLTARKGGA